MMRKLKEQCKKQQEEISRLEQIVMLRDEELKYSQKALSKKDSTLEEITESQTKKIKAIEAELRDMFGKNQAAVVERHKLIDVECNNLLQHIMGLERSSMHGHHMVPTSVNVGLMVKIRESAETIKGMIMTGDKKTEV
jgi:hypothetical protein